MKNLKTLTNSISSQINQVKRLSKNPILYLSSLKPFASKPKNEDNLTKRFDHIRYNRKLNQAERKEANEEVFLYDNFNEPTNKFVIDHGFWKKARPHLRYEVMIPYESYPEYEDSKLLDETEIKARIFNLLRQFDFMELDKFDFTADYEKELGLDSLDWTALLTSIEYEFHTAFNDTFYEHWRTVEEVVQHLKKDNLIF